MKWRIWRESRPSGYAVWRVRDPRCRCSADGNGDWCASWRTHSDALAWVAAWYEDHPA